MRRLPVVKLLSVLLLSGGLLAIILTFSGDRSRERATESFHRFLETFEATARPIGTINLSVLYNGNGQFRLLHPHLDFDTLSFSQVCSGRNFDLNPYRDRRCSSQSGEANQPDAKWSQYKEMFYGLEKPSLAFLLKSPLIAPDGVSYALHFVDDQYAPYHSADWIRDHLAFFRPSELGGLLRRFHIDDSQFALIAQLGDRGVRELAEGVRLSLNGGLFLIRDETSLAFSPLRYRVYDARALHAASEGGDYELKPLGPNQNCLVEDGSLCWALAPTAGLAVAHRLSNALAILLGLVAFGFFAALAKIAVDREREGQWQRLALQVLSHEFRTPVSSLLLLTERLSALGPRLAPDEFDTLVQVEAEAFRLQRVVEMSRTYLETKSGDVRFRSTPIPSANQWIRDLADDLNVRVRVQVLTEDEAIVADPYWLKYIIGSLVRNAFAHGAEPVTLGLRREKSGIKVFVEDAGRCEFTKLRRMTKPFTRAKTSSGMGLGLHIVDQIIRDWGGRLDYSSEPTTFSVLVEAANQRSRT